MIALSLLRLGRVAWKLGRLWRRGRRTAAVRIAASNVPINSYFLFTVLMVVLYVRLGNRFGAQGRNWLPFLLPIFLTAVAYAPRALAPRRVRRAFAAALLAALLLFDGVGGYYALQTVRNRYYSPAASRISDTPPGRPPRTCGIVARRVNGSERGEALAFRAGSGILQ